MCAVLQTVQTVWDGDLLEEGAPALHRLCEGERSAVSAHVPHTGNTEGGADTLVRSDQLIKTQYHCLHVCCMSYFSKTTERTSGILCRLHVWKH